MKKIEVLQLHFLCGSWKWLIHYCNFINIKILLNLRVEINYNLFCLYYVNELGISGPKCNMIIIDKNIK